MLHQFCVFKLNLFLFTLRSMPLNTTHYLRTLKNIEQHFPSLDTASEAKLLI